jgi:hypothetical protein
MEGFNNMTTEQTTEMYKYMRFAVDYIPKQKMQQLNTFMQNLISEEEANSINSHAEADQDQWDFMNDFESGFIHPECANLTYNMRIAPVYLKGN